MKLDDHYKVATLIEDMRTNERKTALIEGVNSSSSLGVTIQGQYQESAMLTAVRPIVLSVLRDEHQSIMDKLRELGVEL